MDQISEFFEKLFDAGNWPDRWHCGKWSEFHGWLYIISDLAIWAAYFVIPVFLIRFLKKKPGIPLAKVFWLFGLFILFCGLTHLMDAIIFWWPAYRLSAILRLITGIVSWITVFAIYKYFPQALALKTSREFSAEIAERRKSEMKFMGLLESAPDAMVIAGKDGKIIMINAQTEKLFGYKRDELIGHEVEMLIPERFNTKHQHHRKGYTENPKVRGMGVGMELFGKQKNGTEFPVEISLSPMHFENDPEIIIIAAIRDITQKKGAESEIKKLNESLENLVIERTAELELALKSEKTALAEMNQNQLRLGFLTKVSEVLASSLDYKVILENLSKTITPFLCDWCAIDEVNDDGTIKRIAATHVNPEKIKYIFELSEKFPLNREEPHGIFRVIHTLKPELYPSISHEMLNTFALNSEHYDLLQLVGTKSIIILPLIIKDKIYGILILGIDESEKNFTEKDLEFSIEVARRATLFIENAKLYKTAQDLNADLEYRVEKRTQELAAINKELEAFSYSVSHDLRAPLRSIDGFSNILIKDYKSLLDDQGINYFNRIIHASQQMGHLIDDLLKLSRLSRIELNEEPTDLSLLAESIANELKLAEPERNVTFRIQEKLVARVDRNLIKIALQNLMGNAWKYSRKKPDAIIEFGAREHNGETVYFVKDNGVGFDMKYVDKLFGAFQRLHSSSEFEGNGIGLATVQRIIRRHHGKIWTDSKVNYGTTFFFTV